MFDFFKNLFTDFFGGDDDDDEDDISWSPITGDDASWSVDVDDALDLGERLIDDATGGEYVQEFYDIQGALDYVEGTPENVLMIMLDTESEVYYVYRFDS